MSEDLRNVRRSSRCYENRCVEAGSSDNGVGIRDSKTGDTLVFASSTFRRFLDRLKTA